MTRTVPTQQLTDRATWRRVLARLHPDSGGSEELFVFGQALKEEICASARTHDQTARRNFGENPTARRNARRNFGDARRAAASEPGPDRVPFDSAADLDELTSRALILAENGQVAEPYARLLRLLAGCASNSASGHRGASYKQLAACGHAVGFTKSERRGWYRVGELVPLSEVHALFLIEALKGEAA